MKKQRNDDGQGFSEAELVSLLVKMMSRNGYRVRIEVSNMGQSADLVATKGRWTTVIEAKLKDWRRALIQCKAHEHVADYIGIAIATASIPQALLDIAATSGYGLLHYHRSMKRFRWVLFPRRNASVWSPQRRHWARSVRRIAYAV